MGSLFVCFLSFSSSSRQARYWRRTSINRVVYTNIPQTRMDRASRAHNLAYTLPTIPTSPSCCPCPSLQRRRPTLTLLLILHPGLRQKRPSGSPSPYSCVVFPFFTFCAVACACLLVCPAIPTLVPFRKTLRKNPQDHSAK